MQDDTLRLALDLRKEASRLHLRPSDLRPLAMKAADALEARVHPQAPEIDVERRNERVQEIITGAINRALRAEVDPVMSFDIKHRLAEKQAAIREAVAALSSLGGELGVQEGGDR